MGIKTIKPKRSILRLRHVARQLPVDQLALCMPFIQSLCQPTLWERTGYPKTWKQKVTDKLKIIKIIELGKTPFNASPFMTNAIRKYTHVSFKKHEPNTETSSNILSEFIGLSLKSIASHLFTRPIVLHSCRARRANLYWNYQRRTEFL